MKQIFPILNIKDLKSKSKYEYIPSNLRPLGDEIKRIAEEVYGSWLAINWHGSIPRGDFVPGESDADITIITKDPLLPGQREQRMELLDKIQPYWQSLGIMKMDVIAVAESEIHDEDRRNVLFFCLTDGIDLPGSENIDLTFVLPKNLEELITLLNRAFRLWIDDVEKRGENDIKGIEQLRKRVTRAMYSHAMINGAPYERSWRKYAESINIFSPQYSESYERLLNNNFDFNYLISSAKDVAKYLSSVGIIFDKEW